METAKNFVQVVWHLLPIIIVMLIMLGAACAGTPPEKD